MVIFRKSSNCSDLEDDYFEFLALFNAVGEALVPDGMKVIDPLLYAFGDDSQLVESGDSDLVAALDDAADIKLDHS